MFVIHEHNTTDLEAPMLLKDRSVGIIKIPIVRLFKAHPVHIIVVQKCSYQIYKLGDFFLSNLFFKIMGHVGS